MTTFLAIFLITTVAAGFIAQLVFPARSGLVVARLRALHGPTGEFGPGRMEGMDNRSLLRKAGLLLDPLVAKLSFTAAIDHLLTTAAMPWKASEFLALTGAAMVAGAIVGHTFVGPFGILIGAAAGAVVPYVQVRRKGQAHQKALNEHLPDALMLMVNALRAGNSLTQAMHVVSQQMPAPINAAFAQSLQEINFGLPIDEALHRLEARFGGIDMALATAAINIQRETGGNLAEILDNIHNTIRDRQTVQGEMRALTAQGRLSGWVLSLLPVGIGGLFFLLNRKYILTLFIDPRGHMLIGGAVVLTIIGMLAIRKIVNVPY
jgi:tight adherence protein B